jgi:hypothetical protein
VVLNLRAGRRAAKYRKMNFFKIHCTHLWNYHNETPSLLIKNGGGEKRRSRTSIRQLIIMVLNEGSWYQPKGEQYCCFQSWHVLFKIFNTISELEKVV